MRANSRCAPCRDIAETSSPSRVTVARYLHDRSGVRVASIGRWEMVITGGGWGATTTQVSRGRLGYTRAVASASPVAAGEATSTSRRRSGALTRLLRMTSLGRVIDVARAADQ